MFLYKIRPKLILNLNIMGRLPNGINGPIVGKVGTVIGSSRNGKPYVKGPHKPRTKKVSKKELANRKKFRAAQLWLKPLLKFVREGYRKNAKTSGAFVAAKSYLLRNAFEGVQPDIRINPALMKVSTGDLSLPNDMAVEKIADNQFRFSWDTGTVEKGSTYDQVMMLAYDTSSKKAYFKTTGQFRSTGADTLNIPPAKKRAYQLYMAFTAADRSEQSDSVYLGEITV
jgi:hypothetical protein